MRLLCSGTATFAAARPTPKTAAEVDERIHDLEALLAKKGVPAAHGGVRAAWRDGDRR